MTALRVSGQSNVINLPKKASQAFTAGALVAADSTNGQVVPASASSSTVLGIIKETIATTDADYATQRPAMIDALGYDAVIQMDVTGTLTTAMVGQYLKLSTSLVADAGTATATPAAGLILVCIGFISATLGLFKVSGMQQTRPAA